MAKVHNEAGDAHEVKCVLWAKPSVVPRHCLVIEYKTGVCTFGCVLLVDLPLSLMVGLVLVGPDQRVQRSISLPFTNNVSANIRLGSHGHFQCCFFVASSLSPQ